MRAPRTAEGRPRGDGDDTGNLGLGLLGFLALIRGLAGFGSEILEVFLDGLDLALQRP